MNIAAKLPNRRKIAGSVIYHVLVAGFALVMLYPLLWMFASSFKPSDEVFRTVTSLIPSRIDLDNFARG